MILLYYLFTFCLLICGFECISGETPRQQQQQQQQEQNNAAMALINSVTGTDDDGRSRQRVLTFAAKRYYPFTASFLLFMLVAVQHYLLQL